MSTAYLLWGPPGAGKSTLKNVYGENTILKNTDDIVDFVCNPNTQDEYWACRKDDKTKSIDRYLNHLTVSQGKNLAIETTGNWYGKYLLKGEMVTWAQELKKTFKKVVALVVYVNDVGEIWKRIQNRDQLSVTEEQLKETYRKSYKENMITLIQDPYVDDIQIYDNSGSTPYLLVTKKGMSNAKALKESSCYRDWFLSQLKNTSQSTCGLNNNDGVKLKF